MDYFEREFASVDVDEAEHFLTQEYGHIDLDRGFAQFHEHVAGDSRFALVTAVESGGYGIDVDPNMFIVAAGTGVHNWAMGRESGSLSTQPAMFQPHHPYVSDISDSEIYALVLDPAAFEHTARLLYGRDDLRVRFDSTRPVSERHAELWLATAALARSHDEGGSLGNDLFRTTLYRLLAVTALESFRLIGDRAALRTTADRLLRVYRAGSAFLHDYASLPITIDDAAEAAGASIPELVQAFRAHAPDEASPTDYLRRVRLDAAHRDLLAGDPTLGDTVQDIAQRWGFSPRGFATHYRTRYGRTPKWTLDR